jgi:hypothetical protein
MVRSVLSEDAVGAVVGRKNSSMVNSGSVTSTASLWADDAAYANASAGCGTSYGPEGDELVLIGTNFIVLSDAGRIVCDYQFLDK